MREKVRYKDKLTSEMGENPNASIMNTLTKTSEMGQNPNAKLTLLINEENSERFTKYLNKLVDRDDHLNQSLLYQFYCEDLDFNYTVFYDNKVGFEFGEYLKGDVNEIGKQIGPNTLHGMLDKIKTELMSKGSISKESIFCTDAMFTLYVKTQILPILKTILLVNKECIKPPMNLYLNPPKGMSDYMIRLGKNPNGGYYLKINDEDLMNLNWIQNVMN